MTDEAPFWRFSLAFYARTGVAEACLVLQDGHGVDVNLLLFALFAACHGQALDTAALARLDAACQPWRDQVVRPLRAARRWLKTQPEDAAAQALRRQIQAAELEAERQQQALLQASLTFIATPVPQAAAAVLASANITALARAMAVALPPAPVAVLLAALG